MLIDDYAKTNILRDAIGEMEKEMTDNTQLMEEGYDQFTGIRSSQIRALLALLIDRGVLKGKP